MLKTPREVSEVHRTYLLPEAYPRTSVEGQEDERVRRQVLVHACVDETRGIEDLRVGAPEVRAAVHQEDAVDAPARC